MFALSSLSLILSSTKIIAARFPDLTDSPFLLTSFFMAGWLWYLVVVIIAGVGLYSLSRRPSRAAFWWAVGFAILVLATALSLRWWPWWPRHVLEETKPLKGVLNEALFFFLHLLIYIGALVVVWVVQRRLARQEGQGVRPAIEWVLGVVVLIAVVVDTCVVNHLIREVTAQEARENIQETNKLTTNLLKDPDRATSSFVIQDQAITKIVSQIYVVIKDDFPEIELKAVSLHVIPQSRHSDKVWNLVQVGRETKDKEFLDLHRDGKEPGSLVAAAIILNRRMYCSDVQRAKELRTDCSYYEPPATQKTDYAGIACFPVRSPRGESAPFAGICIDGGSDYPWERRLDELERELKAQSSNLFSFLQEYKNDDKYLFNK